MRAANWLMARREWRQRWGALALLAMIVAVGGGATIAAAAATKRTDTAFERLVSQHNTPNLSINPPEYAGFASLDPSLVGAVRGIDGVRGGWSLAFIFVAPDTYPNYFAVAVVDTWGESPRFSPIAGHGSDDIGALGPDEVLVNEAMRDELGKDAGDAVILHSLTKQQAIDSLSGLDIGSPAGPTIHATIAGVGRTPDEVSDAPDPFFLLPPAFYAKYGDVIGSCQCVVELSVDPEKLDEVSAAITELYPDVNVQPAEDYEARISDTVSLQSRAWWLIALAAAAAGLFALAQAMTGFVRTLAADDDTQRAIGMTTRERRQGRFLVLVPPLVVGTVGAAGVALALSPLSPVGVTRRAEPDPGLRWDSTVVVPGILAVLLVALAVAAASATLVRQRRERLLSPVRVGGPTSTLGSRLAFGPGRGAIVGVFFAAVGLAGALTLERSIDHVLATPRLYGADADASAFIDNGEGKEVLAAQLANDPAFEAVALVWVEKQDTQQNVLLEGPDGSVEAEVKAYESVVGTVDLLGTQGRGPARPDEVAIGSAVLRQLGLRVGDRVTATGSRGTALLTITGNNMDPGVDVAGLGVGMTLAGLETLVDPIRVGVVVRFAPGVDDEEVLLRYADSFLRPMMPPSEVDNIGELGGLPLRVGQLLALLGLAAVANALVLTARRGRRPLAIHRALGFTSRQMLGAYLWLGAITGAIGTALGGIVGFVIGRAIVRQLVTNVGAVPHTILPSIAWAVAAACVVVSLLAATVTGWLVLRRRPGAVLRTE